MRRRSTEPLCWWSMDPFRCLRIYRRWSRSWLDSNLIETMIRLITICFFIALLYGPCSLKREEAVINPRTTNVFPELAVKQRLQQSLKTDEEKNVSTITPFRMLNNRQAGIVFPASLCYSDSGGLYISDNNGRRFNTGHLILPLHGLSRPKARMEY